MNFEEKKISEEYIYSGRILNLRRDKVRLPDGNEAYREVVEHNGGACVAALTEDNEILLVKQYRYPYAEEIFEIPAGKRESKGEDPLLAAKRELKEETGATAADYVFLGELYPTPGYCEEIIYMYGAKNLTFGETCPDEDEFLSVEKVPLDSLTEMIMAGEIKDAKTQAAVLKLKALIEKGVF
ncbi:MAG: NUDIX hydrolase [Clostridiales bacterium]|nr:NUDIX hydrolase [Candidatus Equinaster intestinalis]